MNNLHNRGDHWIVASNIGCESSEVNVYDSVYNSLDQKTEEVTAKLFGIPEMKVYD